MFVSTLNGLRKRFARANRLAPREAQHATRQHHHTPHEQGSLRAAASAADSAGRLLMMGQAIHKCDQQCH